MRLGMHITDVGLELSSVSIDFEAIYHGWNLCVIAST